MHVINFNTFNAKNTFAIIRRVINKCTSKWQNLNIQYYAMLHICISIYNNVLTKFEGIKGFEHSNFKERCFKLETG